MANPKEPPHVSESELKMPEQSNAKKEVVKTSFNLAPVIISAIIVLVIVLIGLLSWSVYSRTEVAPPDPAAAIDIPPEPAETVSESNETENAVATTPIVNTAQEIKAISDDIENIRIDNIDVELKAIETELGISAQ